ncbi:DUF7344 domain-containing protein [Natronorarus salvus]|uniref:DUF7344 domain-containing protein n=1 Tax=Natronorarus salvus TaxID=3117733 RepID=UPI002F2640EF
MTTLDTLFDLLRSERRRHVLYHLNEQKGEVPVEEVVAAVTAEETDGSPSPGEFEEVEVSLRHVHLPKAAEAEFIEYDREEGLIQVSGTPPGYDAIVTIAEVIDATDGVD